MNTKLNLAHAAAILPLLGAAAADTTVLNSGVVDTQGFDSVAFIVHLGDVADTSELILTALAGDESDGSDLELLNASANFTADADSADDSLMLIDIQAPRSRYVSARLNRNTAGAAVNSVIAILYNSHEEPVIQSDKVVASSHINDPSPA